MKRSTAEIAAEVFAAFMHSPRTRRQLYDFVGVEQTRDTLAKYLKQFRASGLLYVSGYTDRGREILALQPKPFALEDAPAKPTDGRTVVTAKDGKRREVKLYEYRGEKRTIGALAELAGVGHSCMWQRLERGMSPEAAVAIGGSRKAGSRARRGAKDVESRPAQSHTTTVGDYLAARGIF